MKIEDCKTVNEFFGVKEYESIWIEGIEFDVACDWIAQEKSYKPEIDGRALVGCLTGQLKWTTEPPKPGMTAEEEQILRGMMIWLPNIMSIRLDCDGDIFAPSRANDSAYPFNLAEDGHRAYDVLTPILEKHGEINLSKYRD